MKLEYGGSVDEGADKLLEQAIALAARGHININCTIDEKLIFSIVFYHVFLLFAICASVNETNRQLLSEHKSMARGNKFVQDTVSSNVTCNSLLKFTHIIHSQTHRHARARR